MIILEKEGILKDPRLIWDSQLRHRSPSRDSFQLVCLFAWLPLRLRVCPYLNVGSFARVRSRGPSMGLQVL